MPRLPGQRQVFVTMAANISPNQFPITLHKPGCSTTLMGQSPAHSRKKIPPGYHISTFQLVNPSLIQLNKQLSCSTERGAGGGRVP